MLLIIQNDQEVPPGNFTGTINKLHVPYHIAHPYNRETLPQVRDISAAIVLGGAMGVHDTAKHPFLVIVKEFIRECVQRETPFLGVCLGGQLLAEILGGRVIADSPCAEKGTLTVTLTAKGGEDPLFSGITRDFISFHWHNDSFKIPEGAIHLAFSAACSAQAFRFGPCAWGMQFHPEVDQSIVANWASWERETKPCADKFLADFSLKEKIYLEVSHRLLGNFLRLAGFTARKKGGAGLEKP